MVRPLSLDQMIAQVPKVVKETFAKPKDQLEPKEEKPDTRSPAQRQYEDHNFGSGSGAE